MHGPWKKMDSMVRDHIVLKRMAIQADEVLDPAECYIFYVAQGFFVVASAVVTSEDRDAWEGIEVLARIEVGQDDKPCGQVHRPWHGNNPRQVWAQGSCTLMRDMFTSFVQKAHASESLMLSRLEDRDAKIKEQEALIAQLRDQVEQCELEIHDLKHVPWHVLWCRPCMLFVCLPLAGCLQLYP